MTVSIRTGVAYCPLRLAEIRCAQVKNEYRSYGGPAFVKKGLIQAQGSVAERAGFEPAVPVPRNTRSPGAPVQPLRHLSHGPRSTAHEASIGLDTDRTAWRRGRDSNPRYPRRVYRFSRPALSTTQPPLRAQNCIKGQDEPTPKPRPYSCSRWPIHAVLRVDTFETPYLALLNQPRARNVIRTCSKPLKPHVFHVFVGPRRRPVLSDPDSAVAVADPRPEEVGSAE